MMKNVAIVIRCPENASVSRSMGRKWHRSFLIHTMEIGGEWDDRYGLGGWDWGDMLGGFCRIVGKRED